MAQKRAMSSNNSEAILPKRWWTPVWEVVKALAPASGLGLVALAFFGWMHYDISHLDRRVDLLNERMTLEIQALRAELHADIRNVRTDLQAEMRSLRIELQAEMREGFVAVNGRIDQVNARPDQLNARIDELLIAYANSP